jgi:hypothetical protein
MQQQQKKEEERKRKKQHTRFVQLGSVSEQSEAVYDEAIHPR